MLHEERFERNPSMKLPALEHHSSMQEFQTRLSHVWHRLPLLKVSRSVWRTAHGHPGNCCHWQCNGCRNVGSALTGVAFFMLENVLVRGYGKSRVANLDWVGDRTLMPEVGVYCEQMAEVVVLWGLFLITQQLKSRYHNCTWQYFTIFGVQVLFLLAVTAYSVRCAPSLLFLRLCNRHTAALSPRLRLHAVVHLLLHSDTTTCSLAVPLLSCGLGTPEVGKE